MTDETENLAEAERRVRHFAGLTDAGDWGYVATIMDEYDRRGAERDEAMGLLRELVDADWRGLGRGGGDWTVEHRQLIKRARALVERTGQGGET